MASPKQAATLALAVSVFVVIGMLGFSIADEAVGTSTGTQTVTNETVTAQVGEYVDLDGYELVSSSVTVYAPDESTGTTGDYNVTTEGTDYALNETAGSIQALAGGEIADEEEILVTYDYQATGPLTTLVVGFVPVMIAVLIFVRVAGPIMDMV